MAKREQPKPPPQVVGEHQEPERPAPDAAAQEVQATVDRHTAQGYVGVKVDPVENEAYTMQGQAGGAPTPEKERD